MFNYCITSNWYCLFETFLDFHITLFWYIIEYAIILIIILSVSRAIFNYLCKHCTVPIITLCFGVPMNCLFQELCHTLFFCLRLIFIVLCSCILLWQINDWIELNWIIFSHKALINWGEKCLFSTVSSVLNIDFRAFKLNKHPWVINT